VKSIAMTQTTLSASDLASLASAARWAVTLTTASFVIVTARALGRAPQGQGTGVGLRLGVPFLVAAAFAHLPPLTAVLPRLFPVGFALGFLAAVASLFVPRARQAFAAVTDADVRLMLAFRAIYGALLVALAGVGIMPPLFALTAGLGDLAVGWLAVAAPRSLAPDGSRAWRLVVHGLGLADLLQVAALAVTVVRPWSTAHGDATDVMTLPWVAVPLMMALNLHGFWQACTRREPEPRASNQGTMYPVSM